jgi:hypothetical protein
MGNLTRTMILTKRPCLNATAWMKQYPEATAQELWDTCPRGDWLLWVCRRFDLLDNRTAAQIVCMIVRETPIGDGRTVWDLLEDERSRNAIKVTEGWVAGNATFLQVNVAADAAYAAAGAAADAAADAAAYAAAYAAADAADVAADAAYAAADAATYAAADAAADAAAYADAYAFIADIVRRYVPVI